MDYELPVAPQDNEGSVAFVERAVVNSVVNEELVDNEQASPDVFSWDLSLTSLPLVNQHCVFVFSQVRGHFRGRGKIHGALGVAGGAAKTSFGERIRRRTESGHFFVDLSLTSCFHPFFFRR